MQHTSPQAEPLVSEKVTPSVEAAAAEAASEAVSIAASPSSLSFSVVTPAPTKFEDLLPVSSLNKDGGNLPPSPTPMDVRRDEILAEMKDQNRPISKRPFVPRKSSTPVTVDFVTRKPDRNEPLGQAREKIKENLVVISTTVRNPFAATTRKEKKEEEESTTTTTTTPGPMATARNVIRDRLAADATSTRYKNICH